ncbi:MAG: hypothetical protein ACLTBA_00860 [Roseburia intestinalis]
MKRKNVSARILPGVLAFSMVAATGTSSMTVFAAEESAVEAEQITGTEVKSETGETQEYQYAYAALSLTWVHLIPYREQPPITDCTGEVISVRQKLQKKMVQSSKWHIIQEQPQVC